MTVNFTGYVFLIIFPSNLLVDNTLQYLVRDSSDPGTRGLRYAPLGGDPLGPIRDLPPRLGGAG